MGQLNTELLEVKIAVQIFDKDTKAYNGYYKAKLGCIACGVDGEFFFNCPPVDYDGPKPTSPQMLDDEAWVLAGAMATAMCSHIEK